MSSFTKNDIDRIKSAAEGKLLDVINDFRTMDAKSNGHTYVGTCPVCGESKGLELNTAKQKFGCFRCRNIKGGNAVTYLMSAENKSYTEALEYLAHKFSVLLDEKPEKKPRKVVTPKKAAKENKGEDPGTFCARMLAASGLTYADVTAKVYKSDDTSTIFECKTFHPGSVSDKGDIIPGDDAVIEYYDLDGMPVTYEVKDSRGRLTGKRKCYYRVRWQHPDAHLDREGKPFKYKSPYGGGTPIYIPQKLRAAYKSGEKIERLFIQEGEKKAEKACKHGLLSIAISGIQNLGHSGALPEDLVSIISKCGVKEVIFLMDSDWNDLSDNIRINDSIDRRPRNFFYACRNFKDYMRSLKNRELYVEIYVGHTNKNDNDEKGIDDLLAGSLAGHEDDLMADFNHLINEKGLTGKYLQLFKVTSWTDHKLEELWCLNSPQKFAEKHLDILRQLPEFRIGRHRWRINDKGALESAQPIEPDEQFWDEVEKQGKDGPYTVYEFKYVRSRRFLQNRGFGRFRRLDGSWQFIHLAPPFVKVIEPSEARDYLFEFTEANCNEDVNEMISKGVTQYCGPDKLSLLKFIEPNFINPSRSVQYIYFGKNCWQVTEDKVKEMGYESIAHHVWIDQQHNFPAKYLGKPLISFSGEGDNLSCTLSEDGKRCHFLQFLINASNFTWRRQPAEIEPQELQENITHLLSKLCAIGFMSLEYKDVSVNRAVIGMDGRQSEVGESNGRSGKSLIGVLMKNTIPTAYLPGKRKDLLEDQFVWNDVVENTKLVFIDDVLINFNFEQLFPNLTGDWSVNYKGGRRITYPYSQSPKIYIATNHAIRGDGGSFKDRQWLIAFSDFYNDSHKPKDDFGYNFFDEWDYDQWNLCWNLVANCIQLYLRYGVVQAPGERLEQRRLRQEITEGFISWADEYFSNSENRNRRIPRKELQENYFLDQPVQRKFMNSSTDFKRKLIKYCEWKGYVFNPQKYDPVTGKPHQFNRDGAAVIDDKSGGVEYFTIGDEYYNRNSPVDDDPLQELDSQGKISF